MRIDFINSPHKNKRRNHMANLLLHITFILKSNQDDQIMKIEKIKPNGRMILLDKNNMSVPISITEKIYMERTTGNRIGFQCDFKIKTENDITLIPILNKENKESIKKISSTDLQHKFDVFDVPNCMILNFKEGYQLWIDYPFHWLYKIEDSYFVTDTNPDYMEADDKYLDYKSRNWVFDTLSTSVITPDLEICYVQTI